MTIATMMRGAAAALAAGLVFGVTSDADAGTRERSVVVETSGHGHVHHRHHRHHRHHHSHSHGKVHAPYTTVTKRRVVVDAPYADVRVRRGHGVRVVAPFVDVRVAR